MNMVPKKIKIPSPHDSHYNHMMERRRSWYVGSQRTSLTGLDRRVQLLLQHDAQLLLERLQLLEVLLVLGLVFNLGLDA
jgi:hypothetical protein